MDKDPDFVQWTLNFFNGGPYHPYNSAYYANATQNEPTCYNEEFPRVNQYCNVENDEVNAYTLEEGFRQLSLSGAPGSGQSDEEDQQASGHSSPVSGDEDEEADTTASDEENSCASSETEDESSSSDGENGKTLTQHVPRTNGEIPSVDDSTSDHQRLLARLKLYDLTEVEVEGDGNCQFRALSDQFYGSPEHHKLVRQLVVNQLKAHPDIYDGYVTMAYGKYIKKMSKDGEWGDNVTLQAAADWYGVKIRVLTSFKDTCFIEIFPSVQKSDTDELIEGNFTLWVPAG